MRLREMNLLTHQKGFLQGGGVNQSTQYLPCMHEDQSLIPRTCVKNNNNKNTIQVYDDTACYPIAETNQIF